MARMSIDDMFLRDPRVKLLAVACGWSKYEARGRLLDVFAVVYDRVDAGGDDALTAIEIDTAAEFEGLAERMIASGLAEQDGDGVRIRGAKERTKYLASREESGRIGGIKSGESRRKKAKLQTKVTFAKDEGRVNPPDPVPVPDPVLAPDQISDSHTAPPARAIPRRTAYVHGTEYDSANPANRRALAQHTWSAVSRARVNAAKELGIDALAFPERNGTPSEPRSFQDLLDRVAEEGADAPQVCDHVVLALVAEAREQRTVDWLSEKAFTPGCWRHAREWVPNATRDRAPPKRRDSHFDAIERATERLEALEQGLKP